MEKRSLRQQKAVGCQSPAEGVSKEHVIPYEVIGDDGSDMSKIKCSYCCKVYDTVQEHEQHNCRKVNDFILKCLSCKKRYVDHFVNEVKEQTSVERECPNETSAVPGNELAVSKVKPSYQCCICEKIYPDIPFMVRHIKYHVQRKAAVAEPTLHCGQCDKSFSTKQQLIKHETVHSDARPFKCSECDKWFKTLDNVKRHMYVHNDARPYACPTCGKEFKAKHMLKKHEETHSNVRLFKCPECQKEYKAKNTLRDHLRVHSGQRPYKCQECGQAFYRPSHLSTHKLVHSKAKPFSCKDCDKKFGRREHLKVHERIHSGEKPFKCHLCSRSFNQQAGLQAHLVSHSEDRPYGCLKCRKTFKYQSQVKHHACKLELSMARLGEGEDDRGSEEIEENEPSYEGIPSMADQGYENENDGNLSVVSSPPAPLNNENAIVLIQVQNALQQAVVSVATAGTHGVIPCEGGGGRLVEENHNMIQESNALVPEQLQIGETTAVSGDGTQDIIAGIEDIIAREILEKIR